MNTLPKNQYSHTWRDVDPGHVIGERSPMRSKLLYVLPGYKPEPMELAQCAVCRAIRIRVPEHQRELFLGGDGLFNVKAPPCKEPAP